MWTGTVGLVNASHKYLTAENFGYKINANGITLKKKQLWSLEPFPLSGNTNGNGVNYEELAELENVAIKSHLGCYLAVDNYGNVTCESKDRTEGARFTINICAMSSEKGNSSIFWAFKNVSRGYYLGATSDGMLCSTSKQPQSRSELWNVHLIPARGATMFALKSIGRKRYARASPIEAQNGQSNGDQKNSCSEQIQVDATMAWGSESLFQFKYYEGGRYALLTSGCKYLTSEGACIGLNNEVAKQNGLNHKNGPTIVTNGALAQPSVPSPPPEVLFTIEYHGGFIAFRDLSGRYLAGSGRASVLRTRSSNVSKDELFVFEEAPIQISLRATFNNKWVSVKQGVDLSANQNEITGQFETFQLLYIKKSDTWNIQTKDGHYWALGAASTIQASSKDEKTACHYRLKWNEDGTTSILLSSSEVTLTTPETDMKWICNRKSGQLCTGVSDPVKFYLMLRNRTVLNLRASSGSSFVGLKTQGSGKLESNKTSPDSIVVEYTSSEAGGVDTSGENGFNSCFFKMPANNKYWTVIEANQVVCDAASPSCAQRWIMELRNGCSVAIRTYESSNSYLNLTNQGAITVISCNPKDATLWEF